MQPAPTKKTRPAYVPNLPQVNPRAPQPAPAPVEAPKRDKPIPAAKLQTAIDTAQAKKVDLTSHGFTVQTQEDGEIAVTPGPNAREPKPGSPEDTATRDLKNSGVDLNDPVDVRDDPARPGHVRAEPRVTFENKVPE